MDLVGVKPNRCLPTSGFAEVLYEYRLVVEME